MEKEKIYDIVPKIEQTIKKFEERKNFSVANCTVKNISNRDFVVEVSKLVANEYENLFERLQKKKSHQFEKFQERVKTFPYKSTGKLLDDIEAWAAVRKAMIDVINSSADSLDQSHQASTICRLLSSVIDLLHNLDSLSGHKVSDFVTKEAFGIHPVLGLISQAFCTFVPHLAYLGLLCSFVNVMHSKFIMRDILTIVKKDIELFENIENWFEETKELDKELKNLFPSGIDVDIVSDIEDILTGYDSYTKVFSAVFFSNVKQDVSLMKDETFLCKACMFSKSDIALEWYKRTLKVNHPIEFEAEKMEFRAELMRLAKSAPDSDATVELCGHVVKLNHDPHLVQATINCVSVYFSFKELLLGAKHKDSELLKELAERSKACLNELENIKSRLEGE